MVAVNDIVSRPRKVGPRPVTPKFSDHPDLRRRNAEKTLFGKDAPEVTWSNRLSPTDEVLAFKRMHFAAYMIDRSSRARGVSPRTRTRRMAKWRARYDEFRERLTNHNMGLVYEMLRRSRFRNVDQDELLSEGLMALLRSV